MSEGRPSFIPARPSLMPYVALAVISIVFILQDTKRALLPSNETNTLRGALVATLVGLIVLRSGWMRDNRWREQQRALGTLANNFYEPRRESLTFGFSIAGGVFAGLWWGLATWGVVLFGMRRGVAARGLLDFEVATVCGIFAGAVVGAVIGLAVGHVWEGIHRRMRRTRHAAHA